MSQNCLQEGVVRKKGLQRCIKTKMSAEEIFAIGGNKATGLKGLRIKIKLVQRVNN